MKDTLTIKDHIDARGDSLTFSVSLNRPALFYRAFMDHMLVKNGWIEKDSLIQLRRMIDEVLDADA